MAAVDDSGNHPVDQLTPSERDGSGDRMALDHAPGRLERLRTRAQRTRADLEARRAGSASIDSAFEAVERDAQTGGGVLAAAVAFRLFMFLVPYAFVVVTGFGLASTGVGQDPEDAARSAGIGGLLASAVGSTSSLSLVNRILALVLGGIALAFTARSLVGVLWIVHRLIWGVQPSRKPTPWAPLILLGCTTALFGFADLAAWMGSQSIPLRFLAFVLTIVGSGTAWFLASLWLPHDDCEWTALLPGAVMVGLGVGLLHLLTITYVAYEVSRKSSLYGAIGVALALLLWMYFAGRLLTASIAANASLWKRRKAEGALRQ
ncbi:MAG TPA: YhjD/YihY/BrkB family envelope integrity protein [Acidimicrobiales bacterium]|nr:YhjD/YihY/BrkB family envelope integrity protein [Acidimicrobiales bacterium]